MPKIRLELDRMESYALLVATECLRQLFCEEDGGIPLVASIRPCAANREYTELGVLPLTSVQVAQITRWHCVICS